MIGETPEDPAGLSTSTLSNVLIQNPEPGRYRVRARVDLASGEVSVDVTATAAAKAPVVLNAGTVRALAVAGEGKSIPSDIANRVRFDVTGSDGETAGGYGQAFFTVVPAGRWILTASLGNASAEVPVDVAAGEAEQLELSLPVGLLVLRGKAPDKPDALEGVQWRVAGPDGQDVFCERYFTEIDCTLAAGSYAVTASHGDAVVNETVAVPAGERVVRELTLE
jgi:hypothetical protein